MDFYDFARGFGGFFIKLTYRMKCVGLEKVPKDRGFILCSNHKTVLDPIFVGIFLKQHVNFMAKEELFKTPILGKVITMLGAFPVKRGKGDTGAVRRAINIINENKVFAIFPEGTRSKTGETGKFLSGASVISEQTGADIVPVAVCFSGKLKIFKRVTVRYGDLIKNSDIFPETDEKVDKKQVNEFLREKVKELLENKNEN